MRDFSELDRLIEQALSNRTFPGIVADVRQKGASVYHAARGNRQIEPVREPMSADTIFDLASVTKSLSTAILTVRFLDRQGISPDLSIGELLPGLAPTSARVTLGQLLLHTSGHDSSTGIYGAFGSPHQSRKEARRHLFSLEPVAVPGSRVIYSCTNYLLLAEMLRDKSGRSPAELFREEIAVPLGLRDTGYLPDELLRQRAATTEYCGFRRRWIRGEVHDENAWCLGGDAGNAGLFGQADEISTIVAAFLNGGAIDRDDSGTFQLVPASYFKLMTESQTDGMSQRRTFGMVMGGPDCPVGPDVPTSSFGHTGFTGTSFWIDASRDLSVVVLTNRVHYGRDATAEKIRTFRSDFHRALLEIVDRG